MRRSLILMFALSFVLIGVVSWSRLSIESSKTMSSEQGPLESAAQLPADDAVQVAKLENSKVTQQTPVVLAAPVVMAPTSAAVLSASRLDALPLAMQREVIELSGREAARNSVVEVRPGVFLMANGPRVVPVAVMNDDGTVSIHEY